MMVLSRILVDLENSAMNYGANEFKYLNNQYVGSLLMAEKVFRFRSGRNWPLCGAMTKGC